MTSAEPNNRALKAASVNPLGRCLAMPDKAISFMSAEMQPDSDRGHLSSNLTKMPALAKFHERFCQRWHKAENFLTASLGFLSG
ncbi:MAG: hypothetical protein QM680_05420 [Luteolibacter sp.]